MCVMRNWNPVLQQLKYYLLLPFFLGMGLIAFAQNKVVTGRITDSKDGSALSNVSVVANGTTLGTQTDANGYFHLTVPLSVTKLTISAVGFSSKNVDVSITNNIDVVLETTSSPLDEVVVIGYGTAKKKDLTGSIASVSEKHFNKGIFASPDQLIQGKVSGVQISNDNGQPGGAATIKIRGNSSLTGMGQPLYVIDGVPLDGRTMQAGINPLDGRPLLDGSSLKTGINPLNFINTDDIASIDVLKDASATAIYGSRAAYGVVIINTKKAQAGQAKMNATISTGVSAVLKKIKMLNASQFRDAIKYYGLNAGDLDKGENVDAFDAILQKAVQQNYTIGVTGGNETGKYRLSANMLNKDGIIINTGFKKYGVDLVTDFKFLTSKKLGLDINVNSSQYVQDVPAPEFGAARLVIPALK